MACRILVPRPGTEPGPLPWEWGVLTTGPPGQSRDECSPTSGLVIGTEVQRGDVSYSKLHSSEVVDLKLKYWPLDTTYHMILVKTWCFSPLWTGQIPSSLFKIWKDFELWHAEPDFFFFLSYPKSPENDLIIPLVGRPLMAEDTYSTHVFIIRYLSGI